MCVCLCVVPTDLRSSGVSDCRQVLGTELGSLSRAVCAQSLRPLSSMESHFQWGRLRSHRLCARQAVKCSSHASSKAHLFATVTTTETHNWSKRRVSVECPATMVHLQCKLYTPSLCNQRSASRMSGQSTLCGHSWTLTCSGVRTLPGCALEPT